MPGPRLLFTAEPVDEATADQAARIALTSARAGLLNQQRPGLTDTARRQLRSRPLAREKISGVGKPGGGGLVFTLCLVGGGFRPAS